MLAIAVLNPCTVIFQEIVMDDREKDDHELVGIWDGNRILCICCAGQKTIAAAQGLDRIEREDVVPMDPEYCDVCGKLLISEGKR